MADLLGTPKVQYFDGNGNPLVGGKLYSYSAGTLTPKNTYPTSADAAALTNPNTNPVILDARGEANVFLQGSTKLALYTAADVLLWTVDNLGTSASAITDENGNELLKFSSVVNAVNEWTITNASTGNSVRFDVTGGDTNASGKVSSKGSGALYLDGGATGDLWLNNLSTGVVRTGGAVVVGTNMTVSNNLAVTNALGVVGTTTLTGALTANGGFNLIPPGVMFPYGAATAPSGYLNCDGTAVSRTTYAALFAVIGTSFGVGDGSTTFNLPSSARRTLVGRGGSGTATLANTVGSSGGEESHVLTTAEMASHAHTIGFSFTGAVVTVGGTPVQVVTAGAPSTSSVGSDQAHNNIQPSLVVNYIIKV